jgi:hypothetical protein
MAALLHDFEMRAESLYRRERQEKPQRPPRTQRTLRPFSAISAVEILFGELGHHGYCDVSSEAVLSVKGV